MKNIESLQLFRDLQFVSTNFTNVKLNDNKEEIDNNRKLKASLNQYHSQIDKIKEKCSFVAYKTKEEVKDLNSDEITNLINELNNFSRKRYNLIKEEKIECTTTRSIMFSTIDELTLINKSISNKDYIEDRDEHLYIYHQITSNAFATFLALKVMNLDENVMNALSQAIFNQIKAISIL